MINEKLLKEITQYCEFNNIEDVEKEVNRLLRIGFSVERFGVAPFKREYVEQIDKKPIKEEVIEVKEEIIKPPTKRGRPKKEKKEEVKDVEILQSNVEEIVQENNEIKPKKKVRIIKNS